MKLHVAFRLYVDILNALIFSILINKLRLLNLYLVFDEIKFPYFEEFIYYYFKEKNETDLNSKQLLYLVFDEIKFPYFEEFIYYCFKEKIKPFKLKTIKF